jgi:hypothetical protein
MEVSVQLDVPAALSPGKNPGTQWIEDYVGPRAGLDEVMKRKKSLPSPYRESNPGCPTRSLVSILTELLRN